MTNVTATEQDILLQLPDGRVTFLHESIPARSQPPGTDDNQIRRHIVGH
jgi:hypothetical protein